MDHNFWKIAAAVTVAGFTFTSSAANYTFTGNSGDPDNIITNEIHYSAPLATILPTDTVRYWSEYVNLVVNVPEGMTFGSKFLPCIYTKEGKTFTLNVDGTWFQPDSDVAYANPGVQIQNSGALLYTTFNNKNKGSFSFSNGTLSMVKNEAATDTDVNFTGTFNFYNPNGTALSDNSLYTFQGPSGTRAAFNFLGGCFSAPIILDYGEAKTNEFNFLGGSHYVRKFQMRPHNSGVDTYDRTRIKVAGEGTALKLYEFEANSGANIHGYSFKVENKGALEFANKIQQRSDGEFEFVFNDGRLFVTNQAANTAYWNNPRIHATNSVFTMSERAGTTGNNNLLVFSGIGFVDLYNVTFNACYASLSANMLMQNGSYRASYGTTFGSSAGEYVITFKDVTADFGSGTDTYVALTDGAVPTVVVTGNTSVAVNNLYVGNASGAAYGTFDVRGGTVTVANRLIIGSSGSGKLKVAGGKVSAKSMYTSWNSSSSRICTLEQSGGEVAVADGIQLVISGDATTCTGEVKLVGGILKTPFLKRAYATGTGIFIADGGKLVATAANTAFVTNLNTAAIGANGLTVESDHAITIPQNFTDFGEADGQLILTGTGTKTISGTANTVSKIVAAGGKVVFPEGAHAESTLVVTNGARVALSGTSAAGMLKGLTVGDAVSEGVLELVPGETLAVAGDVQMANVKLVFTGDYGLGTTNTLLTATGNVSEESAAAWRDSLIRSDIPDGVSYAFTTATNGEGVVSFTMAVTESSRLIEVKEGTPTLADDYAFGANELLTVAVSNGAALNMSGKVSKGMLSKVGGGRFYLTNPENLLLRGITTWGGLFSVPSVSALGYDALGLGDFTLKGGTFEFTGSGQPETFPYRLVIAAPLATNAVVLKTESPLTVSSVSLSAGAAVKRGAGTLTFAPGAGTTTTLTAGNGTSVNGWDPSPANASFDDEGTAPVGGYLGFSVAEGEVRLEGADTNTVFNLTHNTMIGLQTASGTAQPVLTVDGARANIGTSGMLHIGGYRNSSSFARGPVLNITNGAYVSTATFIAGRSATANVCPTVTVDNATFSCTSFRAGYCQDCKPRYFIRNGAKLLAAAVLCYGPSYIDVTNSVFAMNAAGDCFDAEFHTECGEWVFRAGSLFCCRKLHIPDALNVSKGLSLVFDGGTWETGGGAWDTFGFANATNVLIGTRGTGGLTLPVASGKTVRVARAIAGTGPLVKTGAGTLRFEAQETWNATYTQKALLDDPVSLAFEGLCDVREGRLEMAGGAIRAEGDYRAAAGAVINFGGNTLATPVLYGAGTFTHAALLNATVNIDVPPGGEAVEPPTFADVTFSGKTRVDFGRTVENPVDQAAVKRLLIALYTGTAPDVSGWKLTGTGLEGVIGTFTAENGEIRVSLTRKGLAVMLR